MEPRARTAAGRCKQRQSFLNSRPFPYQGLAETLTLHRLSYRGIEKLLLILIFLCFLSLQFRHFNIKSAFLAFNRKRPFPLFFTITVKTTLRADVFCSGDWLLPYEHANPPVVFKNAQRMINTIRRFYFVIINKFRYLFKHCDHTTPVKNAASAITIASFII